jgi:DNA-directed RNA polymerase subunit beta'
MRTTVGQLLINEALPEDLRDYNRPITSKSVKAILREVANEYPTRYNDVAKALMDIGAEVSTVYGNEASMNLKSLKIGDKARKLRDALKAQVAKILANPKLDDEAKNTAVIKAVGSKASELRDLNFAEQLELRNALAMQVNSGARGNPVQFSSTNVGDMLVADHRDNVIPVPLLNSYSEGLDPVEYWAGSYGARKGMVDLKFATPKGGFLGKQLALAAHRLRVTEEDCGTQNGIPVDADDPDNEGALLARAVGDTTANEILDPKTLKKLKRRTDTIIVRSPLTCQAKGGICAKCAGVRERGKLPEIGDNIGIAAAQAIAEPVAQSAMSSKHSGGIAGAGPTAGGFDAINQLVQVPKTFKGGAAVATVDGTVESIETAPQGGKYVVVGGQRHYVAPEFEPLVAPGDKIEAGDVLSQGLSNPSEIVKYKGVGDGRWHFMNTFRKTLQDSKISANRRNIELLSRGLINHVRITDPDGPPDTMPDDVIEYGTLVRGYTPRPGTQTLAPKRAVGQYLEAPHLQYSIGTRITPRIAGELKKHGVGEVQAHPDVPSFAPEMVRAMEVLGYNEDWMVRLGGFHLKKNLLQSVHRGLATKEHSESFIPSMAKGLEFGKAPVGPGEAAGSKY